jgi:hypothetical protein
MKSYISEDVIATKDAWARSMNNGWSSPKSFDSTAADKPIRSTVIINPDISNDLHWKDGFDNFPPPPPGGGGGASIGAPKYRMPSSKSQNDERKGVFITTDVVKNASADMSDLFDGEPKNEQAGEFRYPGLVAAYLLFCSFPEQSK